jgi:hypothetical protein
LFVNLVVSAVKAFVVIEPHESLPSNHGMSQQ